MRRLAERSPALSLEKSKPWFKTEGVNGVLFPTKKALVEAIDQAFAAALHDGIQPCLQRSGIGQWLLLDQTQVARAAVGNQALQVLVTLLEPAPIGGHALESRFAAPGIAHGPSEGLAIPNRAALKSRSKSHPPQLCPLVYKCCRLIERRTAAVGI